MVFLVPAPGVSCAAGEANARRVLIVYESDSLLPAAVEIARGLQQGFDGGPYEVEFYSEYLDALRFQDPEHLERQATTLAAKYSDVGIEVVLAAGPGALRFMIEHRQAIAPGVPLVFGAVTSNSVRSIALPSDSWGVLSHFDTLRTIDLAQRLQPDARRIVVVTGSADFDRSWQARVREELSGQDTGMSVEYLSGLSLEGFKEAVAQLSGDTILLILTVVEDASGRTFVPRQAAADIASVAGVPAYGVYSTYVGTGVLGGVVETFEGIGADMAALASSIIAGVPPEQRIVASTVRPMVDWRQLKRWGISTELLPEDVLLEFYEPTDWERYRTAILAAMALLALLSVLVSGLIVVDRRRRVIQQELALERLELAHLSRISQLGQLSGAFAHELNQPLTSILANAEAGVRLLENSPPDLKELKEILGDIVADDRRAAGVITQLRQLMIKGEVKIEPVDINKVVTSTIELAKGELVVRQTTVDFHRNQKELLVNGNIPQLQQVVLNLMLNAAQAMSHLHSSQRRITVETGLGADGMCELSIADRGPGISAEMRSRIFKPFVSGGGNGMGLGLSICRSIALAHGGTLAFDEQARGGARVVLTLPSK